MILTAFIITCGALVVVAIIAVVPVVAVTCTDNDDDGHCLGCLLSSFYASIVCSVLCCCSGV